MRMSDLDIPMSQLIAIADDHIYNARNKAIFFQKLKGRTYEEIAEEYHLSTNQTKAIVKDCLNRITKHVL